MLWSFFGVGALHNKVDRMFKKAQRFFLKKLKTVETWTLLSFSTRQRPQTHNRADYGMDKTG